MRTFDAFYLRPTNGRAEDQERRNHSAQYISHPDWPWFRLRKEAPSKYESYFDLVPGTWTRIKIEVNGTQARLYVHGNGCAQQFRLLHALTPGGYMAAMKSAMIPLGTPAPSFALRDAATGNPVVLADFANAPLVVAFLCNHCPYVKHMLEGFVAFARDYGPGGVGVVAICSNDARNYPADSPAEMAKLARAKDFPFPYLVDETQEVARAYTAACTPDLYLFGPDGRLVYRGQFDGSRPGSQVPVTGADLRAAVDALLSHKAVPANQIPSVGCSIKWKSG